MTYFKIGSNDYSTYTNELKIVNGHNYNAQTNAAGDTVVDYINCKREIEVGIIPLNDKTMKQLMKDIQQFNVSISFRNPITNELETIDCIIPENEVEYYTIQVDNVLYKAFSLTFAEL